MKRSENRLKVKKLFVLGAGASYCASTSRGVQKQSPLDKDFCGRLESLDVSKPYWVNESRDKINKAWKDHIPFKKFGLEQAIIRHLGNAEFIDAIHKRKRTASLSSAEYLNHLSHLVCYVLRKARENRGAPYELFVDKYLSEEGTKNRVITFNYDELLDKHLLEMYTTRELYFDKMDLGSVSARREQKYPDPVLVKLHGSVNWRCAKDDLTSIVNGDAFSGKEYIINKVWHSGRGTPSPNEDASPLIIPPLPVKPITSIKLFCFLWTKAYEYLHEARELVICGYSLPEADRLAQSMFANFTNKKLKSIIIVDPNPEILSKWRDLFRRSSISNDARWTYFESFSEYVKYGV